MSIPHNKVEAIAAWLKEELHGDEVEWGEVFDRMTVVIRVWGVDERGARDFELTGEALDDHSLETIIGDLERFEVISRLLRDPSMRLCYYTRREVPPYERRAVDCDGKRYRILRDSDHNVRIYDSRDRPLENLPEGLLAMTASIFRKHQQRWCEEIRPWRGDDQ